MDSRWGPQLENLADYQKALPCESTKKVRLAIQMKVIWQDAKKAPRMAMQMVLMKYKSSEQRIYPPWELQKETLMGYVIICEKVIQQDVKKVTRMTMQKMDQLFALMAVSSKFLMALRMDALLDRMRYL
eukprot:12598370-Ditylum_brightwellii.AAC.1